MSTLYNLDRPSTDSTLPRWSATSCEWVLGVLLVAGPLSFGATEAWGQQIVLGLVALAALLTLAGAWRARGVRLIGSWTYLPIALLLAVVAFQLIPLPAGLYQSIAPGAAQLRHELVQLSGEGPADRVTATLYPLATERQLRLLLGGALLFVVVLHVYIGQPDRQRRLLRTIVVIGLAMALLGIGQYLTNAQSILGLVAKGNPYSGTFANHSHFGQFINLSIGAAAALMLAGVNRLRSSGLTLSGMRDVALDRVNWDLWVSAALLVLGPAAVLVSLTRGGFLSLLMGAAVFAGLVALTERRQRRSDAAFFSIVAGGAVLLVIVGIGFNAAYDRLASLRKFEESSGGRLEIIRDAVDVWRTSPWVGTGLGTHAYVFSAFDRSQSRGWASHAENEYVQLLEEAGVLGVAALLIFIGMIYLALARGILRLRANRSSRSNAPELVLPGLALGLIAVTLHSATDFGQHLPGVAFLTAITCALVLAIVKQPVGEPAVQIEPTRRSTTGQAVLALATAAVIVGVLAVAPGMDRDRRAEQAWWSALVQRGLLDLKKWSIDAPEYREMLAQGIAAQHEQPRDVEYTFWLNAWRWEAITQQTEPGAPLDAQLAGWTQQMIDELRSSVAHCPTFGRPMAFAGQLIAQLPDGNPAALDRAHAMITRGAELAPYDPQACFAAGQLAAKTGDRDHASALLNRAVAMGYSKIAVLDVYATTLNDPAAAREVAGENLDAIDRLLTLWADQPARSDDVVALRAARGTLLTRALSDPTTDSNTLDRIADRLLADNLKPQAIDALLRATATDYANVNRRMRLAQLLADEKRYADAVEQASIALRFRAGDPRLTQQIEAWKAAARAVR